MNRFSNLALQFAACLLLSSPVSAQTFESLIKNVSDINFFASCWNTRGELNKDNDCPSVKNGYGVEISYEVWKLALPNNTTTITPGKWKRVRKEEEFYGTTIRDSTIEYEMPDSTKKLSSYLQLELGLAYSQFTGFSSTDPSFELRGTVREIPGVSVYGTWQSDDTTSILKWISPYVGLRSGLLQLNNVQILDHVGKDSLQTFSGSGQTFQLGFVSGLAIGFKDKIYLFVEQASQIRRFQNVQWAAAGTAIVRDAFPKSLDFSGPTTTIGIQISLK